MSGQVSRVNRVNANVELIPNIYIYVWVSCQVYRFNRVNRVNYRVNKVNRVNADVALIPKIYICLGVWQSLQG